MKDSLWDLEAGLEKVARLLAPQREALAGVWTRVPEDPGGLDALLSRLSRRQVEGLLLDDAAAGREAARTGASLRPLALAVRAVDRCCLPFLRAAASDGEGLARALAALAELGERRLGALLRAFEDEAHHRLAEAQDQAAGAAEAARELARANQDLRRAEARSQHRADQIGLLHVVARRLVAVLEPERLMQEAADAIRVTLDYTFVAVVLRDAEGALVGRWAGRPGVGRQGAGRTQGPPGGIIGRALRQGAPQVVGDVAADPDYHADVPGTRSEMAVPLLDAGQAVGALDVQSEQPQAFDLDDVAAAETVADFLVVALRNARRFTALREAVQNT